MSTVWMVVVTLAVIAGTNAVEAAEPSKPNFIIVLADDLGYGDLACYGNHELKTPNLDKFATEGVRLTSCYAAAANCSPARAGLLTGRTPYRLGIHNWIPMFSPMHLRPGEVTIATLLRKAGYATCHSGKWHLNGQFNLPGQPQPADHGFDHWFSAQNNALPNHRNPHNFVRNGTAVGQLEGYSADIVANEAISWLREGRNPDKPFFLFVCFHEPHEPIASARRFTDLYPSDDPSYSAHHGNISQMDHAFGRLMQTVDELELRDTTFVMFTSDNGPAITSYHPHGSSGPLREHKGHVYEGGIRVPGILRWPGRTQNGATCDEPVCGVDLLPTLCEITGIPLPGDRAIDGASFLPILQGKSIKRRTPLYWQFNYARTAPKVAMRDGEWKILATLTGPQLQPGGSITEEISEAIKTARLDKFELYNLRSDIGETTDLSQAEPERFKQMSERLQKLYTEVQNESPRWPPYEFARYEAQRIEWPDYTRRPANK